LSYFVIFRTLFALIVGILDFTVKCSRLRDVILENIQLIEYN